MKYYRGYRSLSVRTNQCMHNSKDNVFAEYCQEQESSLHSNPNQVFIFQNCRTPLSVFCLKESCLHFVFLSLSVCLSVSLSL